MAIVVVLAFVVLVSGLVVAFFSRSVQDRQISSSSANDTKVELFAKGALDTIISDLKQEIANGSSNLGTSGTAIYSPNSSASAMPFLVGSSGTGGLENVLKVSAPESFYSGTNYSKAGPKRASSETGALTTVASMNGRQMTKARWNKPLLMEPKSASDHEPKANFTPPSWILVSRDGSNPTQWNNSLRNSGTNPSSVVGRYAYAIYNEGGLLDANAAGYPLVAATTVPSGVPEINDQTVYKSSPLYADLAQIGLSSDQISKIVGWRNYASIQASGKLSLGYSFPQGAETSAKILSLALDNPTGFLTTGTAIRTDETDRMFVGRQQLISFLTDGTNGLGLSAASPVLQSLSVFSRSLNQPSYAPHPNRPKVVSAHYDGASASEVRGNSGYAQDDVINPVFRKIKVGDDTFTRNDGSQAVAGEALVKKRFSLKRLCWITCEGPSRFASNEVRNAYLNHGIPAKLLEDGTQENIEKYFGLRWNPGPGANGRGGHWTYSHGFTAKIGVLDDPNTTADDVLRQKREPDFFELLKAAITVGAVGRGGSSIGGAAGVGSLLGKYQHVEHTWVDNQIVQIGANIIDQSDPDNFPTRIIFNDGIANRSFWGTEDLPYFYGTITTWVVNRNATPSANIGAAQVTVSGTYSLPDRGALECLHVPVIWNPHALGKTPSLKPEDLRICVSDKTVTGPTVSASSAGSYVRPRYMGSGTSPLLGPAVFLPWVLGTYNSSTEAIDMPPDGAPNNTALKFKNRSNLYREPTPLVRVGVPSGSELVPDAGNLLGTFGAEGISEVTGTNRYIGMYMGRIPYRWTTGTTITSGSGSPATTPATVIYTARDLAMGYTLADGVTYSVEYNVGTTTPIYIPYQQKLSVIWGTPTTPSSPLLNTLGNGSETFTWDPRARRWNIMGDTWRMNWLDADKTIRETGRPGTAINTGAHGVAFLGTSKDNYIGGLSVMIDSNGYVVDADGVTRRPMGAWVPGNRVASDTIGLPMATAWTTSGSSVNAYNRPLLLQRPFRSVSELGYVFSDTPWRNLDFFTPESGFAALLDVFCINEAPVGNSMVAGRVDLNTRRVPVLKALLAGAGRDETTFSQNPYRLSESEAESIAAALVDRTANRSNPGKGPLANIAELVGRYGAGFDNGASPAPIHPYDGFSKDLGGLFSGGNTDLGKQNNRIQRLRETVMRALSDTGQAGTWNLLVDLVAQVGRYPSSASGIGDFVVEGEKRYWLHVAIDRQTAEVIDYQIEPVNE